MPYKKVSKCNLCKGSMKKVIYAGLPGRLCENEDCNLLTGPALWIAEVYFNGMFFQYEGNYFSALWHWLTDKEEL